MSRKFLVPVDLAKNELLNPRIQNLASAPSSPVSGQMYYDTVEDKIGIFNGSTWDYLGTGEGTGDLSSNTSSSVDGEMVLFSGTSGKTVKRATGSGLVKITSGVVSTASAGTDYLAPNGNGSALTGITQSQVANLTSDLALKAPLASPTFTGTVTVPTPSAGTDAANKNYVDNAVQGLAWKQAVRVATTATVNLSNGLENGDTIDGVTLSTGDRVLVKNQSSPAENGIYVVVASGAASRATDANTSAEIKAMAVYVEAGTANADTVWSLTTDNPTLDSTSLTFAQINGGTVPQATTSTQGKVELATQAEAQAKTDTDRALTPASVADFARKYTGLIGNGSDTDLEVTHGLGSQWVTAQVFDASTNLQVECDVELTSSTVTTFTFASAPSSNAYRVVITG